MHHHHVSTAISPLPNLLIPSCTVIPYRTTHAPLQFHEITPTLVPFLPSKISNQPPPTKTENPELSSLRPTSNPSRNFPTATKLCGYRHPGGSTSQNKRRHGQSQRYGGHGAARTSSEHTTRVAAFSSKGLFVSGGGGEESSSTGSTATRSLHLHPWDLRGTLLTLYRHGFACSSQPPDLISSSVSRVSVTYVDCSFLQGNCFYHRDRFSSDVRLRKSSRLYLLPRKNNTISEPTISELVKEKCPVIELDSSTSASSVECSEKDTHRDHAKDTLPRSWKDLYADRGASAGNLTGRRCSGHRGSLSLSLSTRKRQYLVKYKRKQEDRREVESKEQRGSPWPILVDDCRKKGATVKGNGGFGDYSAAGEFEVWGDEQHASDGVERQVARPPSRQQRCEGGSSLRPLLHVAHCELHSPREPELLRLDHLEALEHKSAAERNSYSMMENFHSPVPPPLPRRHVRAQHQRPLWKEIAVVDRERRVNVIKLDNVQNRDADTKEKTDYGEMVGIAEGARRAARAHRHTQT
ncbi:hypothetical protein WN48_10118 [Eufriesea mexicana]|nr:hypothetical protein WN48_10118 [Eufriesea mexicana]